MMQHYAIPFTGAIKLRKHDDDFTQLFCAAEILKIMRVCNDGNHAAIWKNDRLGKSGYPGISQYKFSEMGYPRITKHNLG